MKLELRLQSPKFIAHSARMKARREKYHKALVTPSKVMGKYIPAGVHKNTKETNH